MCPHINLANKGFTVCYYRKSLIRCANWISLFSQALQVVTNALRRHVENAELYYYQGNFFKDLNNMQQAKKVRTRNFSS